jgi:hypothetical protein
LTNFKMYGETTILRKEATMLSEKERLDCWNVGVISQQVPLAVLHRLSSIVDVVDSCDPTPTASSMNEVQELV